jgi:hypothetical protein
MEGMRYSVAPDNIKVALVNPAPVASSFVNHFEREAAENCGRDHKPSFFSRMAELAAEGLSKSIAEVIQRELPKKIDKGQEWVTFWNGTSDRANEVIAGVKCDATGYKSPQYSKKWKTAFELADAVRADVGNAHYV